MWPTAFEKRFREWYDLRQGLAGKNVESALLAVNDWWAQTPWRPYYLHWDDRRSWPTPWQLLEDNIYCDLARALGIVYTLMMAQLPGIHNIEIIETNEGNLVQIDQGKYILNWHPGEMLNISSANIIIKNTISSRELEHLLG
jgi:hypothetical protein